MIHLHNENYINERLLIYVIAKTIEETRQELGIKQTWKESSKLNELVLSKFKRNL